MSLGKRRLPATAYPDGHADGITCDECGAAAAGAVRSFAARAVGGAREAQTWSLPSPAKPTERQPIDSVPAVPECSLPRYGRRPGSRSGRTPHEPGAAAPSVSGPEDPAATTLPQQCFPLLGGREGHLLDCKVLTARTPFWSL